MEKGTLIRQKMTFRIKSVDEEKFIINGVFSTGGEDRHGEIVDQTGWKLEEYKSNPVVLFAHDHYQPAVGKCIDIGMDGSGNLTGSIQFAAKEYDFAMTLFKLYAGGFMRAFSVGFMNNVYEIDQENDNVILRDNTLYEISCVNVPANAMALAYSKGIDVEPIKKYMDFQSKEKSVVPYADHGTASEDTAWDGPGEMKACGDDLGKLKTICTWFDKENADVKGSYKLPHHEADGYKAVWKGVSAAMAALLGARGGVDIPEGDRQGVYNHLAKHYKQFEKDVPEFKAYSEEELKQIEDSGISADLTEKKVEVKIEMKQKTISEQNVQTIKNAIKTLADVLESAEKSKGPTPPNRSVSVNTLNSAIRQLLKVRKIVDKK